MTASLGTRQERERREIKEALLEFPHSFHLQGLQKLPPSAFKSLKKHLQAGLESGYHSSMETARTCNLLAYAHCALHELEDALELTERALELEGQGDNVVSLANKVNVLSEASQPEEAREALEALRALRDSHPDFAYLLVRARGELASSYLRFGPRLVPRAIEEFNVVLPSAREPELSMWKFGLAVALRQALSLQNAPYSSDTRDANRHNEAMQLLQDVINTQGTSEADTARVRNLQANAHAEMALLMHSALNRKTRVALGHEASAGPMAACKKALALDESDPTVLWKTGKVFRHYKDLFKSRKLLLKAVEKQPSSAAFHHLGLTFKAMATSLKYGQLKTRRSGVKAREKRLAKEAKQATEQAERSKYWLPKRQGATSEGARLQSAAKRKHSGRSDAASRVRKIIKSPKGSTEFDPQEQNVKLAIKYLVEAVTFSEGENSRALYDLALMHKATSNYPEALKFLKKIQSRENPDRFTPAGVLERITALEQMALIYSEMAAGEMDPAKRLKHRKQSDTNFYKTLSTAAELFSSVDAVRHLFGKIFHSPSALLRAADAAEVSNQKRIQQKAEIYKMLNNHKKTQRLLNEISAEERDAEYYRLKLDALVKSGDVEEAAACLGLLKPTAMYSQVHELFEKQHNDHAFYDIYFMAGRKALQDGADPQPYFVSAFREARKLPPLAPGGDSISEDSCLQGSENPSGTSCPASQEPMDIEKRESPQAWRDQMDSTNQNDQQTSVKVIDDSTLGTSFEDSSDVTMMEIEEAPHFDVMIIHDEEDDELEGKARCLHELLQVTLRLNVARMDEHHPTGVQHTHIQQDMDVSRVVVVVPGKERRLDLFNTLVRNVALHPAALVLLTEGVTERNVPKELQAKPRALCPPTLFAPDVRPHGPLDDATVEALCKIFRFLSNTEQ